VLETKAEAQAHFSPLISYYDETHQGFCVIHRDGEILAVNGRGLAIIGKDIHGQDLDTLDMALTDAQGVVLKVHEYPVNRILSTGQPILAERFGMVHESKAIWFTLSGQPVKNLAGETFAVAFWFTENKG
jgi:hypothetical protein